MRHIKRIISAVLFAAMLITSLSAVTVSADESIKVILDGKQLQFDVPVEHLLDHLEADFLIPVVLLGDESLQSRLLFGAVLHENGGAGHDHALKGRGDLAGDDLGGDDGGEAALGVPLQALDLVPIGRGVDVQLIVHDDVVDGGGIGVAVVALDGQGTVSQAPNCSARWRFREVRRC